MSTALHILANRQNMIGRELVLKYKQTTPTPYLLESSGWAASTWKLTFQPLNYPTVLTFNLGQNYLGTSVPKVRFHVISWKVPTNHETTRFI